MSGETGHDPNAKRWNEGFLAGLRMAAGIAEREGVSPGLNVVDGGPEWYKHGQRIAAACRRAAGEKVENAE